MLAVPDLPARTKAQRHALEEAAMVAEWARTVDPEWVRAIGALAEVFSRTSAAGDLEKEFARLLVDLAHKARNPYDDFHVVVRQLRERDHFRAAFTAAKTGADIHADSSYLASVCANCAIQIGDLPTALLYLVRAATQLEAENHPDALRAWHGVIESATELGDNATLARAHERITALSTPTPTKPRRPRSKP